MPHFTTLLKNEEHRPYFVHKMERLLVKVSCWIGWTWQIKTKTKCRENLNISSFTFFSTLSSQCCKMRLFCLIFKYCALYNKDWNMNHFSTKIKKKPPKNFLDHILQATSYGYFFMRDFRVIFKHCEHVVNHSSSYLNFLRLVFNHGLLIF